MTLWRPSNGTLGEMWMDEWCRRCANDTFDEETCEGESCEILVDLLCGGYNEAVTSDPDTLYMGKCAAFKLKDS